MANTFRQPTQSDLDREKFLQGLASAQSKAYAQSQADTSRSAPEIDQTAAPAAAPFPQLNQTGKPFAWNAPKSDTPLLDAWKAGRVARNAQGDFYWDLPILNGDFDPGFSKKAPISQENFDPGFSVKPSAFPGGFDGGFGAGRTVPEQPAPQPSLPWRNTPQYGDDGAPLFQEKLAQTGKPGYDGKKAKIGGLIDEDALDAAIAEAFPEYSPDDDDEDDWLEKPLQPDDEDDWLEPGEKVVAAGAAAWSNPYGGMGIPDADYQAYRAGKLTQDDLLGIARAVALYRAAEGSGNGAYYYQNAAHRRAAEIRAKYDPDYIKNDAYDYTHGGTYDPNGTEPISGPPVYQVPDGLLTDARPDADRGDGYSVFTSPRAPKKDKYGNDADDFGVNDKNKSELYDMGIVVGAKLGSLADLYDENTFDTQGKKQVEDLMKSLASTFAAGDPQMKAVADEMFDHFIDGNGTPYSSPVLTEKVVEHPSTQKFVAETMSTIQDYLNRNGGDLAALKADQDFKKHMDEIRGPKFNTRADLLNGLTICLNDTWGYYADISDYRFDGKNYSGTIRYTVYDHFGLDDADISGDGNWYKGAFGPFAAWYVLQHYEGCEGKYKPFVTYMNFEVPFSGSVD